MQLRHPLARWGLSLLVLSAATAINFGVQSATGRAVPFLPYFPALLLIAVLAGPAPAAVCALASAVVVEFFWLDPAYSLRISRVQDLYALAFFCMANGIIVVAAWHLTRVTAQLRQLEEKNRKSMEVAQAAEERFRIALRGVPVFAWMCGPDRRYTWAYSSVEAIQAEALIGKQLGSVQPPSTYPDFWDTIERVWSTGIGQTLPVEWKQGGVLRQFISSIEPVKDAGGAVVGLLGSAVDVTEMRRA